jgi:putative ABC transport system permease protein
VYLRVLRNAFLRQRRGKGTVLAAVALGTAAATAMGDIALDIGDKVSGELRSFGANLVVLPAGGGAPALIGGEDLSVVRVPSFLDAAAIPKTIDNFWKNNILAIAPVLDVRVRASGRPALLRGTWFERRAAPGTLTTGMRTLNPYWGVDGRWPDDGSGQAPEGTAPDVLVGRDLASAIGVRPGGRLTLEIDGAHPSFTVAGILTTGGEEDGAILAPIESLWRLPGLSGRVSRILVRALTTPESAVYERLGKNPRKLSPAEFERWTCTPFVTSIAYELERVIPGAEARPVWRVADSEGKILRRISGLMAIIALLAAVGSALTVTSAMTTSVRERRSEIGLLKAMGAGGPRVIGLFLAEAAILGILGGFLGAGAGALLARFVSVSVFGSSVSIRPLSLPLAVAAALAITIAGSIIPARRIARLRPFEVLRGL